MKSLTNTQLNMVKAFTLEALRSMNFSAEWLTKLEADFRADNDLAFNADMLANYVSWNMRDAGIHTNNENFADVCALRAVLFGTNEMLFLSKNDENKFYWDDESMIEDKKFEFPTKPFGEWTINEFEQALKVKKTSNS